MHNDQIKASAATELGAATTEENLSNKQSRASKSPAKIQGAYSLPHSSPEILSKILKAYVIASNQGAEAVKYTDVAAVAGLHPTVVSRNNAFLSESGFIVAERYGHFKPSPKTTEFAKQAPWDEAGAKQFIRTQIDGTWFGETVQQQFRMYSILPKSQLIKAFGIKSTPDHSDASKLVLLLDFLLYFDYLGEDTEGNYTLNRNEESDIREPVHSVATVIGTFARAEKADSLFDIGKGLERQPDRLQSQSFVPQININLNITPSTTDEELESLAKKVRTALDILHRNSK